MERKLDNFVGQKFDVCVIGGGIYGVNVAREAALRGLSVALVEKGDFGSATSSNSLKIIHGGLRYLQHADFKRMRESITERRILMTIAPHLVHPLPCVMPTYGHTLRGKEVMALALFINDLIGYDRNKIKDPQKYLPRGRIISRAECMELIPGIEQKGLTGGAVWYDCQVYNSERLLLAILHSAVEAGAVVANYVEMTDFLFENQSVSGIKVRDTLTGDRFEIQARLVINCAGPWVNKILTRLNGCAVEPGIKWSSAMNLVVKRQIFPDYAVGLWSKSKFEDEDALISKGSRLFFIAPWRKYTLVGTTHVPFRGSPDQFRLTEEDVREFIQEINEAYPAIHLTEEDISFYYGGMLPADEEDEERGYVKLLKHYRILDHVKNGLDGLITVIGVKYTTARDVAQKTIDYVFKKWNKKSENSSSVTQPVWGGDIEKFREFLIKEKLKQPMKLKESVVENLILNYGTKYKNVLKYVEKNPVLGEVLGDTDVLKAEIVHSIHEEMALKLTDVVRRRTELGSASCPEEWVLKECANIMAAELNWDEAKIKSEIDETIRLYQLEKGIETIHE